MPDELPIIYFLDEEESQRNVIRNALRKLFADGYEIKELPVLNEMADYLPFLDSRDVAAVFIDQHLDQTGEITGFTGVQLSQMLREHFREMPIYVVTGHAIEGELTSEKAGATDGVVSKSAIAIGDPRSLAFKQQFLRRVGQYDRALNQQQTRFRELLFKRLKGTITQEEKDELERLEIERQMPTATAEAKMEKHVSTEIGEISELLKRVENLTKDK